MNDLGEESKLRKKGVMWFYFCSTGFSYLE